MRKSTWLIITGIAALGFSCATSQCLGQRIAQAVKTEEAIKVDGVLNESAWKNAPAISGFTLHDNKDKLYPYDTQARILFDNDNLYLGVEAHEPNPEWQAEDIKKSAGKFEYGLANVIEVFIDTDHDKVTYDQFLFHANGTVSVVPHSGVMKTAGIPCETAVKLEKDRFFVETAIPLANLHLGPETKDTWGFNVGRARFVNRLQAKGEKPSAYFSIWNNTGGAFNQPGRYGVLEIKRNFTDFYYDVKIDERWKGGDKTIPLVVRNQTGKDRSPNIAVKLKLSDGKEVAENKPLQLGTKEPLKIEIPYQVAQTGATLTVELREGQRVVYRGGGNAWRGERPFPALKDELSKAQVAQPVTVFSRDYTEPVYPTGLPRAREITNTFTLKACPGEYEPATFCVYARDAQVDVRLEMADDFVGANGKRIPRHCLDGRTVGYSGFWFNPEENQRIPTFLDRLILEPSVEATIFKAVSVPKGESLRFWMTLQVPPDAAPGKYTMPLKLHLSTGETVPAGINLEVYPFRLKKPEIAFGMYHWMVSLPDDVQTREYQRMMFKDMAAHGMTSIAMMYLMPLQGSMETANPPYCGVIPTMEDWMAAGFDHNVPIVMATTQNGDLRKKIMALCRERHWPEWIFYTIDESEHGGKETVEANRKLAEAWKKQIPDIRQGSTFFKKKLFIEGGCGPVHDVWIWNLLLEPLDAELLAYAKSLNKEMWTYDCILGPTTPEADRLQYGLYTWALGLKGAFKWVYQTCASASNRKGGLTLGNLIPKQHLSASNPWVPDISPWELYDQKCREEFNWRFDYTWPGRLGPETTIGWELVREGVDDYCYLITLEAAIKKASETNPNAEPVLKAKAFLDGARSLVKPGATFSRKSEALDEYNLRFECDFSPGIEASDYTRIREQAADLIAQLGYRDGK